MAVDWIGFGYAAAIVFGGFMGYRRKGSKFTFEKWDKSFIELLTLHHFRICTGSVMSMMAGLVFGGLSFYGACNTSYDSKDIKVSLCQYKKNSTIIY